MKRKNRKMLQIDARTWEILKALSDGLDLPMIIVMKNLFDPLLQSFGEFVGGPTRESYIGSLRMDIEVEDNKTIITFSGQSAIKVGSFETPTEESEVEIDKKILEASKKALNGEG
jgi:hypothetical protein